MKEYIGSCIDNPFGSVEKLAEVIDNAKKISKKKFRSFVYLTDEEMKNIKLYPYDYEFYQNGKIFFNKHSCIEYFFR